MNRRNFFKSTIIGSTALFVEIPNINAKLSKPSIVPLISWSNTQIGYPYVDSNLIVDIDNVNVITEWWTNSGGPGAENGGIRQWPESIYDVRQTGIVGHEWPQGATGTLQIGINSLSGLTYYYNNTTPNWVAGVINSFSFSPTTQGGHFINCFVTAPLNMDITVYNSGFSGNINDINTKVDDSIYSIFPFDVNGSASTTTIGITDNAGNLYIVLSNYSTTNNASVTVSGPGFYQQQQINAGLEGILFGPITKQNYGNITVTIN